MKKKTNDFPIGKLVQVEDFLPKPADLAIKEDTIKVTIALNKTSIAVFKRLAQKHGSKYQRMIRVLIDQYAAKHALS